MRFQRYPPNFPVFLFLTACLVALCCFPVSAAVPTVSGITPSSGINTTTVSVTDITGTGFAGPAAVKLTQGIFNLSHKGFIVNGGGGGAYLRQPNGVAVSGNYAYVASYQSNALEIVNIANPAAPTHASYLTNSTVTGAVLNSVNSIFISGNYAYLTPGGGFALGGLEIVNITVPTAPVHEGFLADGTGGAVMNYPEKVFVAGNYAYVVSRNSNSLEIVDVSTPSAPVHSGVITNGGSALLTAPRDVYVSGNYAYVASYGSNALEIVNITDKAVPTHEGVITNGTGGAVLNEVRSVYIAGNYAYLASGTPTAPYGLEIVDISNPAAPVHRGFLTSSHLSYPTSVYVSGNRAYVTSGDGWLVAVDVSDPANPQEEAYLQRGMPSGAPYLSYPTDVTVSGRYAYVASSDNSALEIVDLADTTWYPKVYGTGVHVASTSLIDAVTFNLTNVPAGVYNVVVSNSNGQAGFLMNGFTVLGGFKPTAGFTGTPVTGPIPLHVAFTDASTCTDPLYRNWSFGDGTWYNNTDAALPDADHTYSGAGTYTVAMSITNLSGTDTLTRTDYITASTPPTTAPTTDPTTPPTTAPTTPPTTVPTTVPTTAPTTVPTTAPTFSPAYYSTISTNGGDDDGPRIIPTIRTVNVGGNSGVHQAAVNGTGLKDLIVTGTVVDAPGTAVPASAGTVYQYLDLVPARYTTITGAVISFTVPLSWLNDHHIVPQNVVLYHLAGSTWVPLPTTWVESRDGQAYFTASTPSFSRFAITAKSSPAATVSQTVVTPAVVTPEVKNTPPAIIAAPVAGTPAPARTTASPSPAPADTPKPGFTPAVIGTGAAGLAILAIGAVYTRRWWIRRQNPALFHEYD
jgi:hypothetical protein